MKPKNRVMCPDCGRLKMLFDTEKKAQNFIKYNGEDIPKNGNELRVYFCPSCGGYHITSKPYRKKYDSNTDNLIDAFKRQQKAHRITETKPIESVIQDIQNIVENLDLNQYDKPIKKIVKQIITDYFNRNKGYPMPIQDKVRHHFNEMLKQR